MDFLKPRFLMETLVNLIFLTDYEKTELMIPQLKLLVIVVEISGMVSQPNSEDCLELDLIFEFFLNLICCISL